MSLSIREADDSDIERLVELENILFPNALNERRFALEMSLGACYVIGRPAIAYTLVRPDGPLFDLMRLGVIPTRSGEGFGRRLLEHVMGLGRPVVLTVLRNNARARRLYELAGFKTVGVLPAGGALVQRWDGPSESRCSSHHSPGT
jgi:ribosomal protein S18 acetylase RimI-like enzyme